MWDGVYGRGENVGVAGECEAGWGERVLGMKELLHAVKGSCEVLFVVACCLVVCFGLLPCCVYLCAAVLCVFLCCLVVCIFVCCLVVCICVLPCCAYLCAALLYVFVCCILLEDLDLRTQ